MVVISNSYDKLVQLVAKIRKYVCLPVSVRLSLGLSVCLPLSLSLSVCLCVCCCLSI